MATAYLDGASDRRWFEPGSAVDGDHAVIVYPGDVNKVRAGNYVAIAKDVEFLVGGNRRIDRVTSYPF